MSVSQADRPVLPVCLCISTNSAMGNVVPGSAGDDKTRIALVQDAIESYRSSCIQENMPYRTAMSILIYDDVITKIRDFEIISPENVSIPVLRQDKPYTAVGEVMNSAMDLMLNYREYCTREGLSCLPPVLLLLYAGKRNHGTQAAMLQASSRFAQLNTQAGLQAVLLGISNAANLDVLRQAAPGAKIERVDPWSLLKMIPALIQAMGKAAMAWKPTERKAEPEPKYAQFTETDQHRRSHQPKSDPDPGQLDRKSVV